MDYFLNIYTCNKDYIDLIKDSLYFLGLVPASAFGILALIKYRFNKRVSEIRSTVAYQKKFEKDLNKYIYDFFDSNKGIKRDCKVTYLHYKNFPYNFKDDGYNQYFYVGYMETRNNYFEPYNTWIDKTGVKFLEALWYYGESLYCNKYGVFFIGKSNKEYPNFKEVKDLFLIKTMPFKNIIDYDLNDKVEYSGTIYGKYSYDDKRQYLNTYKICDKNNLIVKDLELNRCFQMKKYSYLFYLFYILKVFIYKKLRLL